MTALRWARVVLLAGLITVVALAAYLEVGTRE